MKKVLILSLCLCALLAVSCKNNKQNNNVGGPSEREVKKEKKALSKEVLTTIDLLTMQFLDASQRMENIEYFNYNFTEQEKLVKPDYLFDPNMVESLVTKTQQVNALALLITERPLRVAYGMPVEDTDRAIAMLAAALNQPFLSEDCSGDTMSKKLKKVYDKCKANNDVVFFWEFIFAVVQNTHYLAAQNSDAIFSTITPEQVKAVMERGALTLKALVEIAPYDPELLTILNKLKETDPDIEAYINSGYEMKEVDVRKFKAQVDGKKETFAKQRALLLQ